MSAVLRCSGELRKQIWSDEGERVANSARAVCAKRLMLIPALANDDRACDDESSCEARDVYRFSECAACVIIGRDAQGGVGA